MDVLNNLLENAVKFTGCGKITLGYTYLDEDIDNTSDSLLFYVKDTGPGISKENTEIVFDRFVKLVDKNETVLKGAGLGLAISHDIVKLMGGDIWLESVEGEGCKFFFTLPLNFSKKQRSGFPKLSSDPVDINWSSCSILIAEDMESNYIYLKELLLPTEIKILRARDGLEAVEIFESNPDIDVVLMDILMPMLDGYEATKRIREIREDVPVVAQTAFSFEGEMQNGLYAGCFSDYIMKPFTRDLLIANIKKYLRAK
jgi:CheY-like chemotaxis protein